MSDTSIPNSIRKIIDEIISSNFRPFTYKKLAKLMGIDPNTLVQRVNRNPEYFEIVGYKPKIIKLNKELQEIYFYRDKNTCQVCQQKKDTNELQTRQKDPYLKDKEDWGNIITCCQKCMDLDLIKKLSNKEKIEHPGLGNYIWEYKEIEIRRRSKEIDPYMELYNPDLKKTERKFDNFYEFDERNGQGWFHIIDDDNNRCENLSDVLNFFGKRGWELIKMKEDMDYDGQPIGYYQCIFKRKKSMEET